MVVAALVYPLEPLTSPGVKRTPSVRFDVLQSGKDSMAFFAFTAACSARFFGYCRRLIQHQRMVAVHRQRNGLFIGRNVAAPGEEPIIRFVEDDRFNRQLLSFTECACIWEDFLIAAIDAHRCIGHWVIGSDLQHNHIIAIDFQLTNLHQVAVCLIRQAELRAHYADIASLNRLVKQNGAGFAGDRVPPPA